jgi:hypothetical protein
LRGRPSTCSARRCLRLAVQHAEEPARADIQFRFESPLHDAIESEKSHKLLESKALLADAIALDPTPM